KLKLSKSQGASTPAELKCMQNVPYASAVGSIMYAVRCTRSDVAFAQNVTSRFQQNPCDFHWTTVKNILKYLRNTKDMFLVYRGDLKRELRVSCYTDAGYLTDADDLKSQTGYVTISMYCDNTGAIAIANESGITKGAIHFRDKVHYLREVIEYGDIKLEKVHTYDNLADLFTKALAFPKHSEHTRNIGMLPASSLMSPVADIRAIRILIAIAAYYDYEIWQIDVKTAFLNGYLNEEEKLKLSKSQEAEYIAAFDASNKAVWVRKFIFGLGVVPTIEEPINMYCDNTGAIAIANES
nr:hypothetical protein [Tanacetum cinerariifolium]